MIERRVSVGGRGVYGRSVPLRPPKRRGWRPPVVTVPAKRGVVLAVIVGAAAWLFVMWFRVSDVQVNAPGNQDRIADEVRKLVNAAGPFTTVWTLDTIKLGEQLKQQDPMLATVQVARVLPHRLRVSATFNVPVMVWSTGNQPYLVDAHGAAISVVTAPPTALPLVTDGSNVPVKVGDRVVSERFVGFVGGLAPELTKRGLGITAMAVAETTFDLTVQTNKGYRLVFDTSREVSSEMLDLDGVMRTLAPAKKTPAEYIDLRISGKAYYK